MLPDASTQRPATAATGFRRLFLCFSFFLREGCRNPLLLLPGWASCPVPVCWRGRRHHHRTKGHREHRTSGAATNDQGNSHNAKQQVSAGEAVSPRWGAMQETSIGRAVHLPLLAPPNARGSGTTFQTKSAVRRVGVYNFCVSQNGGLTAFDVQADQEIGTNYDPAGRAVHAFVSLHYTAVSRCDE